MAVDGGNSGILAWAGRLGRTRTRRLVLGLVAVAVVAAVGFGIVRLGEDRAENGAALAAGLGLPASNACGTGTAWFRPTPEAGAVEVFALDRTWHWVAKCLDQVLDRAQAEKSRNVDDFLYAQVLYVLSRPPVRFYRLGDDARHGLAGVSGEDGRPDPSRFDRIAYTNDYDVAHNAMSQAALGRWLLDAASAYAGRKGQADLALEYEALGTATLQVILDEVDVGGLRSRSECALKPGAHCSWFHAVTARNRPSSRAGGTLNKHLIVTLALREAARDLDRLERKLPADGRRERSQLYDAAAVEGMYQLAYGEGHRKAGAAPNLFDFIAHDAAGVPIRDSWLFYAVNPEKTKGGYYLKVRAFKNCHYHNLDMTLLRRIVLQVGEGADLGGFIRPDPTLGRSLFGFITDAYERKLAAGMFVDTPTTAGGQFGACKPELFDPAKFEVVRAWFRAFDSDGS